MDTLKFVALFLSAAAVIISSGEAALVPMTKEMKQELLDIHNALRARTGRGETGSQPGAADMMLLEWDDRLMEKAAVWAATCEVGHDKDADRAIPGHSWVGQNWAGAGKRNLTRMVERWYEEHVDYNFHARTCTPGKMCGHYTQVVWAMSRLLGCALASCSMFPATLVCNYAEGGNIGGSFPYKVGPPASKCIGEYTYTRGSLCLRRDQCSGSVPSVPNVPNVPKVPVATTAPPNVPDVPKATAAPPNVPDVPSATNSPWDDIPWTDGGDDSGWSDWQTQPRQSAVASAFSSAQGSSGSCRCAIACLNGGTLDSASCKCACTSSFYGTRCEVPCADPAVWRPSCENDPDACKNYGRYCPKTCKLCKTGDITDKNAVNADGVVSRVPPR